MIKPIKNKTLNMSDKQFSQEHFSFKCSLNIAVDKRKLLVQCILNNSSQHFLVLTQQWKLSNILLGYN